MMKKYISKTVIAILALLSLVACEDNDNEWPTGGTPVVRYVRPCDVDASDSLLTGGYLGSKIAIIGESLAGVNEIYFNDKKAKLNPNMVTNNSIIVSIPNSIPGIKEDLIKLYTSEDSAYFAFATIVPEPTVKSMACEYVEAGDVAHIDGLYFIDDENSPLTVTFTGGVQGEIVSQDITSIDVVVPEGAESGPVTVSSIYGDGISAFHFRDQRNIILDFNNGNYPDYDYFFGWHGGKGVTSDGGISGNYLILSGDIDETGSTDDKDYCFDRWTYTPEDADFADASNLSDQVLKFEVKVTGDWSAAALQFIFTGADEVWLNWQNNAAWPDYEDTHGGNENWKRSESYPRGLWTPWTASGSFSTEKWITVSIPMDEFKYGADGSERAVKSAGHYSGLTIWMGQGSSVGIACSPTLWIDNVRVVPID
ncbi:glycan-binding surface protein [Sunxiuqinia indica]|uniref:glycan-binding surface protein n=1 Tax=Sunxiuqinia indica TaxID=2692584 RepID=UPI001358FC9E|nr:glycan-binding surface protein [Sunxiuqinia indica]